MTACCCKSVLVKFSWGGQGGRTLNARITNKLLSIVFHDELCWLSSSDAFHVHCMTKGTRKVPQKWCLFQGQHLFEDNIYNLKVGPNMIIIVLQYGTVLLFSVLN